MLLAAVAVLEVTHKLCAHPQYSAILLHIKGTFESLLEPLIKHNIKWEQNTNDNAAKIHVQFINWSYPLYN